MPDPALSVPNTDIAPIGRRAAARLRLSIPVRFTTIYGTYECILLDLSQTGARIALANPMSAGMGGYLTVAQLEMFGEVVRCQRSGDGGVNALAFDDPLPHGAVVRVRHHADTLRQRESAELRDQVRRWVTGEK